MQNVRNSWFEAVIDGRKTQPRGGPESKDGGMEIVIKQRHKGEPVVVLRYDQVTAGDNHIIAVVTIYDRETQEILASHYIGTDRE